MKEYLFKCLDCEIEISHDTEITECPDCHSDCMLLLEELSIITPPYHL